MSQQTPQDRNLQPIPAWMLKDEEKTGGNAGRVVEETQSPAQTLEPEKTTIALPESRLSLTFREQMSLWGTCLFVASLHLPFLFEKK